MDSALVKRLLELNRNFYAEFSADFSGSRSGERLNLEPFQKYLANDIRLLDAGCGNGRLADALERANFALNYFGVDGSAELIAFAEKNCAALQRVRAQFRVADLTQSRWHDALRDAAPFDVIASLAVLHHIPSFDLRTQVLRALHALLKPRGILVLSNWQFLNNDRLRKKIVAWENVNIDAALLEANDYLLDWKRGGVGYRYVHLLDENEIARLARASAFEIITQFYADANLNLYSILQPQFVF